MQRLLSKVREHWFPVSVVMFMYFFSFQLHFRGVCMSVDGKQAVEDKLSAPISYDLPRPEDEKEKSYFVSNVGVVCDTLYRAEYEKAEKLGDDVAMKLIEQGADEILKAVKQAIPNVANIQLPVSNSGTMRFV